MNSCFLVSPPIDVSRVGVVASVAAGTGWSRPRVETVAVAAATAAASATEVAALASASTTLVSTLKSGRRALQIRVTCRW